MKNALVLEILPYYLSGGLIISKIVNKTENCCVNVLVGLSGSRYTWIERSLLLTVFKSNASGSKWPAGR